VEAETHIVIRYNVTMTRLINFKALADFRYEIRRFLKFSEEAARAIRIEPQQHQALLAIKGLPDEASATVGVLAERLQIHHHSAVELLNRLQLKGLVRRSYDPQDHRVVLLHLTQGGENLLRNLSAAHYKELCTAGPRLLIALKRAIQAKPSSKPSQSLLRKGRAAKRERRGKQSV
jgi:DNA-binding MarR family transcriptional regulator